MMLAFLVCVIVLVHTTPASAEVFNMAYLMSFQGWNFGNTSVTAAQLAVDDIEAQGLLASGAQLRLLPLPDSACSAVQGVSSLLSLDQVLVKQDKSVAMVLGPACSGACAPVNLIASHYNLLEISYSCQSGALSDKSTYPTFARTVGPTALDVARWMFAAMKHFGWSHVGVISTTDTVNVAVVQNLLPLMAEAGMEATYVAFDPGSPDTVPGSRGDALDIFVQRNLRVFAMFVGYSGDTRDILLTMQAKGLRGPESAVMTAEAELFFAYGANGWMGDDGRDEEALRAFDGVLSSTLYKPPATGSDGKPTAYTKLTERVVAAQRAEGFNVASVDDVSPFMGYLYDAVFLYAHVLNAMRASGGDPYDGRAMRKLLSTIEFEGVTGRLHLDDAGDNSPSYMVLNFRTSGKGAPQAVRVFDYISLEQRLNEVAVVDWGTGSTTVPKDVAPIPEFEPSLGFRLPFLVIACVMIVVTLACMVGLVFTRETDVPWNGRKTRVMWDWPSLMQMLVGFLMAYTVVILLYLTPDNDGVCVSQLVLAHLAFAMVFVPLFTRTWLIGKIFRESTKLKSRHFSRTQQFLLKLLVALPIVVYLVVWQAIDPWTSQDKLLEDPAEVWWECESDSTVPLWVLVGVECCYLAAGVWLVWVVSGLPSSFNEAKYIGFSIYNMVVVLAVVLPMLVGFDIGNKPDMVFLIKSVALLFVSTFILVAMFFSKFFMIIVPHDRYEQFTAYRAGATGVSSVGSMRGTHTPSNNSA